MSHFIKTGFLIFANFAPLLCFAQGTLTITFDDAPIPPPDGLAVKNYSESGMYFYPTVLFDGSGGLAFINPPPGSDPNDGTSYLQGVGPGTDSITAASASGALFGVSSIDLAGMSSTFPNFAIEFGGRIGADVIGAKFSGTEISFQTFQFGPEWSSGLSEFWWSSTGSWSVDNLVVIVPEPNPGILFALGALIICLKRRKQL